MMLNNSEPISAKEVRGNGYDEFWRTKNAMWFAKVAVQAKIQDDSVMAYNKNHETSRCECVSRTKN